MKRKKKIIILEFIALTLVFIFVLVNVVKVFAFESETLNSDYKYNFEPTEEPEFYNSGSLKYNYHGKLPNYINQMYGVNNNSLYNSNFGTNVIGVNGFGSNIGNSYGIGQGFDYNNFAHSIDNKLYDNVAGSMQYYNVNTNPYDGSDMINGAGSSFELNSQDNVIINNSNDNYYNSDNNQVNGILPNEKGEITFPSYFVDDNYYNDYYVNDNDDVDIGKYYKDAIGKIKIDDVDLQVYAYDYDDIYQSMRLGVGHMDGTAYWNGNVVYFGHNRGNYGFFNKLKKVDKGDIVHYYTNEGRRKYEVDKVLLVQETDWSLMNFTRSNKITLITCVEDVPELRLVVQATEVD